MTPGFADYLATFPQPPLEMPASPYEEGVLVVMALGTLATVLWAIQSWRRSGTPVALVLVAGGTLCAILTEPFLDIAAKTWYPLETRYPAIRVWGRIIPWWVVFGYASNYGLFALVGIRVLQGGISRRRYHLFLALVMAFGLALEIVLIHGLGMFVYYGYHPFRVLGVPLYVLFLNQGCQALTAVTVWSCSSLFEGRKAWRAILVLPVAQMAMASLGMPLFVLFNTGADGAAVILVAALCIGLWIRALDWFYDVYEWRRSLPTATALPPV